MAKLGRYSLVRHVGSGGMAEVWKARLTGPAGFQKTVAIKRMLPSLGDDFRDLFVQEANLVARLQHPNIVQVLDFGRLGTVHTSEADDAYFLAMEYVSGTDLDLLTTRLRDSGQWLSQDLALYLVSEAAKGLAYAHSGVDTPGPIVHQDVSPHNIMVSYSGAVKLGDFGIAKMVTPEAEVSAGRAQGKVAYMSPEQVRAQHDLDTRTDIYSLAVVLYELLFGKRLFFRGTKNDSVDAILEFDPTQDEWIQRLDPPLRSVLCRALNPDRDKRYQEAGQLAAGLSELVGVGKLRLSQTALSSLVQNIFAEEYQREIDEERGYKKLDPIPAQVVPAEATPEVELTPRRSSVTPIPSDTAYRNLTPSWSPELTVVRPYFNEALAQDPAVEPYRILVVDDDKLARNLVSRLFADDEDVKLFVAESGDQAQAVLLDEDIDVVVSDQRMPGMSGLQFLARVREMQPDAVRILLTAYPELSEALMGINEGLLYRFVVKPWEPEEMRVALRRAAESKRMAAQTRARNQKLQAHFQERMKPERLVTLERIAGRMVHDVALPASSVLESAERLRNDLEALAELHEVVERGLESDDREVRSRALSAFQSVTRLAEPAKLAIDLAKNTETLRVAMHTWQAYVETLSSDSEEDTEACNLSDVVQEAVSRLAERLESRRSPKLDLAEVPEVRARQSTLVWLIAELVSNAYDANPAESTEPVHVRTWSTGRHVVVEVVDSGTGPPPEIGDDLFEPFVTTKTGHLGLGLFIAKRIVDRYAGVLGSHTTATGCCWTVRLPITSAS